MCRPFGRRRNSCLYGARQDDFILCQRKALQPFVRQSSALSYAISSRRSCLVKSRLNLPTPKA